MFYHRTGLAHTLAPIGQHMKPNPGLTTGLPRNVAASFIEMPAMTESWHATCSCSAGGFGYVPI